MSANPEVPAAPRLRAIREAWLERAVERLEADPAISAAGFVGSLGRGDADDWSDIALLLGVPDDQLDPYAAATHLPGSDLVTWSIDSRPNAPRGAGAIGVRYVIDGLPLHVDWYVYPPLPGRLGRGRQGHARRAGPSSSGRYVPRAPGQA